MGLSFLYSKTVPTVSRERRCIMKEKTRLTADDRINLQACIVKELSMNAICRIIDKNRSTIYREIKKYSVHKDGRHSCYLCSKNGHCDKVKEYRLDIPCQYFIEAIMCPKLNKFPFVCNNCVNKPTCLKDKRFYDCAKAERMSRRNRITTRRRKDLTDEELLLIDSTITPLVRKGQSLHHIYITNPCLKEICSERTIRRLVDDGYLALMSNELRRWSAFRPKAPYVFNRDNRVNQVERLFMRTYTDFTKYVKNHPHLSIVQYDSVIGKATDKQAILTITFPKERFQFGRLIKKGDPTSVNETLAKLFKEIGMEKVKEVFAINLSDNGMEFSYLHQMEILGLRVYFTNPYRSTDKAACERNHEFIRYVIPKSTTLNSLTQDDVDLLFSHINSYVRESYYNKTPYELILERFGKDFLECIRIKKILPQDVFLKPSLLK